MNGLIIFFGIIQLLLGIVVILLHSEIKELRYDLENHQHHSSWDE